MAPVPLQIKDCFAVLAFTSLDALADAGIKVQTLQHSYQPGDRVMLKKAGAMVLCNTATSYDPLQLDVQKAQPEVAGPRAMDTEQVVDRTCLA